MTSRRSHLLRRMAALLCVSMVFLAATPAQAGEGASIQGEQRPSWLGNVGEAVVGVPLHGATTLDWAQFATGKAGEGVEISAGFSKAAAKAAEAAQKAAEGMQKAAAGAEAGASGLEAAGKYIKLLDWALKALRLGNDIYDIANAKTEAAYIEAVDNAARDVAKTIGSMGGGALGGVAGTAGGPVGTAIGSVVGGWVGEGTATSLYNWLEAPRIRQWAQQSWESGHPFLHAGLPSQMDTGPPRIDPKHKRAIVVYDPSLVGTLGSSWQDALSGTTGGTRTIGAGGIGGGATGSTGTQGGRLGTAPSLPEPPKLPNAPSLDNSREDLNKLEQSLK